MAARPVGRLLVGTESGAEALKGALPRGKKTRYKGWIRGPCGRKLGVRKVHGVAVFGWVADLLQMNTKTPQLEEENADTEKVAISEPMPRVLDLTEDICLKDDTSDAERRAWAQCRTEKGCGGPPCSGQRADARTAPGPGRRSTARGQKPVA